MSILGCTIYTTLSPCMTCAAMLLQSGVSCVVYLDEYRDTSPLEYLCANGMSVIRLNPLAFGTPNSLTTLK